MNEPARFENHGSVLTVQAVAALCHVSTTTVRKWKHEGRLGYLTYTRVLLFDEREVRDFLRRNTAFDESEPKP
jgi:predicted site-specific integrase-resolvase